jgi:hypothetical protein
MKLRQIVCDKTELTLTKEKKQIKYGDIFEVSEERAKEILAATFKGKPVAEIEYEKATDESENSIENKKEKTTAKTKSKK